MAVIAPLVGAAVGGWAATAMNAAWIAGTWQYAVGTMVGSMLGSMMFPPAMPGQTGPRAQDGMVQVSTYGASIPIVYGTMALSGNVIWSAGLREVKVRTRVGSGKSKTKVTTYSYYCDFAVGLCEGEINCVRRVWLDSDLVYDLTSVDPKVIAANTKFENIMTVYRGSETQLADPVIEAVIGAGDTPAFRGLAYLVFDNLPLQNYGNRIPNVRVELVRADLYYTSEPYPIHVLEELTSAAAPTVGGFWKPPIEDLDAACALASGSLAVTVSYGSYTNYGAIAGDTAEHLQSAADCLGGTLVTTVSYGSYTNYGALDGAEYLQSAADCLGGTIAVTAGYVTYANYQPEEMQAACALASGSLT